MSGRDRTCAGEADMTKLERDLIDAVMVFVTAEDMGANHAIWTRAYENMKEVALAYLPEYTRRLKKRGKP